MLFFYLSAGSPWWTSLYIRWHSRSRYGETYLGQKVSGQELSWRWSVPLVAQLTLARLEACLVLPLESHKFRWLVVWMLPWNQMRRWVWLLAQIFGPFDEMIVRITTFWNYVWAEMHRIADTLTSHPRHRVVPSFSKKTCKRKSSCGAVPRTMLELSVASDHQ